MSVVLVTGATAGLGLAVARAFRSKGVKVVGFGRRVERLKAIQEEFGSDMFHPVVADVTDRSTITQAIEGLPKAFSAVDILVNNAGVALGLEEAHQANLDDWEKMIDTNCKGLVYMTRLVLPGMVERGRGHIINIGSQAAEWPYPGANVYGATKAFVRQFTLNLKADLWGTPIRMTDIEPGMTDGTEFSDVRFAGDSERARGVYKGVEALTPEDIADTVLWVSSRPAHVNVNTIQIMPVAQSFARLRLHKA